MPPKVFGGANTTIIVPTLRTTLTAGEPFELRALVLAPTAQPTCTVTLYTRPMGSTAFKSTPMTNVGRSVFEVSTPAGTADFEYYVQASCGSNLMAVFPAGAPTVFQTVVIMA